MTRVDGIKTSQGNLGDGRFVHIDSPTYTNDRDLAQVDVVSQSSQLDRKMIGHFNHWDKFVYVHGSR